MGGEDTDEVMQGTKMIIMENRGDNSDAVAADQTFMDCIAQSSHWEGAHLTRISFLRCDLYWASFFLASLVEVTFEDCNLQGSDFKRASIVRCRFVRCNLGRDNLGGKTEFQPSEMVDTTFHECMGP